MSNLPEGDSPQLKKPPWLRVPLPHGSTYQKIRTLVRAKKLNTVCDKARCPNIGECWARGTATFIILGETCTRNCRFCAVQTGRPAPADEQEPQRVAQAIFELGLRHAVITSVTRDDLVDGGATLFAETLRKIREVAPACTIEVLVPDFGGDNESLRVVLQARPDVLAHNLETVPRLYRQIRPGARYRQSLAILERAGAFAGPQLTKSGLMLGMGESGPEITRVLKDLLQVGCSLLTLGQYLSPGKEYYPVASYLPPARFQQLKQEALGMGFLKVEAGPLVRSSYRAEALFSDGEGQDGQP